MRESTIGGVKTLTNELHTLVEHVASADSPAAFAEATTMLLYRLSEDCLVAAHTCEGAWQERAAGKPWRALYRKLDRMRESMSRNPEHAK